MFEHRKLQNLEDYFKELNQRPEKGIYFYRINGYQEEIRLFLERYCEAARKTGVVIEGKIPNPEERNLNYYEEIMGKEFRMDAGFMEQSLRKWLPRMNDYQRKQVASSIYDTLAAMGREGKNDNILKNAYIKFLCWLYYKFERIVSRLGENEVPKILYDGTVSNYELKILNILAKAGSDLVLLQRNGDQD
ncbi:MAG: YceG family protein, partial [Lachnospiraceae bacterium]|nr:YceG family protein [Lachnospiraceae bacterium]